MHTVLHSVIVAKRVIAQGGFITLLVNSHLRLQLCSTIPVWSVRFCYFASAILLHPEYSVATST